MSWSHAAAAYAIHLALPSKPLRRRPTSVLLDNDAESAVIAPCSEGYIGNQASADCFIEGVTLVYVGP